jgi:hypothetical protein
MAVEVRRAEERCRLIEHEGLLVLLRRDPEDDHVVVALTGVGIDGVGPWIAEEDEAAAADLVDGILGVRVQRCSRHATSDLVEVVDGGAGHPPVEAGVVVDDEPVLEGSLVADESLVDEPFFDGSLFAASDADDVERLSLR